MAKTAALDQKTVEQIIDRKLQKFARDQFSSGNTPGALEKQIVILSKQLHELKRSVDDNAQTVEMIKKKVYKL